MNHPFVREAAGAVVNDRSSAKTSDLSSRVQSVYQRLFGRKPTGWEMDLALRFLAEQKNESEGWTRYVQALLLTNEFSFID
jgi:hypothetical protein